MTLKTPDQRVSETADLLRSLQDSIRNLRTDIEDLREQIQAGEDAELKRATRDVAAAEGLIRTCQKVEASLVEQWNRQNGTVRGGGALDMDTARFTIGCRLARLRTCRSARSLSE